MQGNNDVLCFYWNLIGIRTQFEDYDLVIWSTVPCKGILNQCNSSKVKEKVLKSWVIGALFCHKNNFIKFYSLDLDNGSLLVTQNDDHSLFGRYIRQWYSRRNGLFVWYSMVTINTVTSTKKSNPSCQCSSIHIKDNNIDRDRSLFAYLYVNALGEEFNERIETPGTSTKDTAVILICIRRADRRNASGRAHYCSRRRCHQRKQSCWN
jgi:hypothetical protein